MSVVVQYPAEVKRYQVAIGKQKVYVSLEGVEVREPRNHDSDEKLRRIGAISFGDPHRTNDADFFTRGGFLLMHRPMAMLSGILDLLRCEKPLFLHENGALSTSTEHSSEFD